MDTIATAGVAMPRLGLGTFRITGAGAQAAVEGGIAMGYRHIDTAARYENEAEVGAGIRASGVPRADLFVTTKVWHEFLGPHALPRACEASVQRLGLDYVDLYLVHWPAPQMDMAAVMRGMARLKEQGLVRSFGVSNFTLPMLRQAVEQLGASIATNQVEYHPFLSQAPMLAWLREKGIPLTAYAPLAQGRAASDGTLIAIGRKHGAGAAQVAIAWLLDQPGVVAIPKAGRPESQKANLDALKIRLDDADRAAIAALPKTQRFINPAFAPAWDA